MKVNFIFFPWVPIPLDQGKRSKVLLWCVSKTWRPSQGLFIYLVCAKHLQKNVSFILKHINIQPFPNFFAWEPLAGLANIVETSSTGLRLLKQGKRNRKNDKRKNAKKLLRTFFFPSVDMLAAPSCIQTIPKMEYKYSLK